MPSLRPWPCRPSRRRQNGHRHPARCEIDRIRTSAPDSSALVTADARRASPENRYRVRRLATPVRHRDRGCSEPTHVWLGTCDASLTLQLTRHRIAANATQQSAANQSQPLFLKKLSTVARTFSTVTVALPRLQTARALVFGAGYVVSVTISG